MIDSPPSGPVAGLLLAAGAGTRFGGPKALVPWHGRLLVEHTADVLASGGCAPVVVVLGAAGGRVRDEAHLPGVRLLDAHDWRDGMGASLRAGLHALGPEVAAVLVALVDQPRVTADVVARLLEARRRGVTAAVAAYAGILRNPVLLDRRHWSAVAATAVGDVGARAWLRANPDLVTAVECGDVGSAEDIDVPDDARRLAADT